MNGEEGLGSGRGKSGVKASEAVRPGRGRDARVQKQKQREKTGDNKRDRQHATRGGTMQDANAARIWLGYRRDAAENKVARIQPRYMGHAS